MKDTHALLTQFGLSKSQIDVFLILYQYGAKPASSVAKMLGTERTNTYKTIQVLVRQGLLAETTKQGVKQFYIPNKEVIRSRLNHQKKLLEEQEELLPVLENALSKFDEQRASPIPKMRFFEGKTGMTLLFDDICALIDERQYVMIKCVASNTLESQSSSQHTLADYAEPLFQYMQDNDLHVETYVGNGILTLEHIMKTHDTTLLPELPAGNAAIHMFIVGDTIYTIIFKQIPFGFKIQSESFADMMHFLLKQST